MSWTARYVMVQPETQGPRCFRFTGTYADDLHGFSFLLGAGFQFSIQIRGLSRGRFLRRSDQIGATVVGFGRQCRRLASGADNLSASREG